LDWGKWARKADSLASQAIMDSELVAGILGGFIGGALGVFASIAGTYYGPRRLEEWRESHRDEPKKRLLKALLENPDFPDGRYLSTLCM
jgi:hypothetical protein